MAAVRNQFAFHCPEVVAEWEHFRDVIAPQDDDAERYRRDHGMHIPFAAELFGDANTGARGDLVSSVQPVPVARDVAFTGSMQWSGRRGRRENIPNVPYVVTGEAVVGVRGRKRHQERSPSVSSSSSSSSDEPEFEYTEFSISDSNARDYVKYIGRVFDDDEDGGTYQIKAICDMRKVGGRRSTNIVFAFKYAAIDGPNVNDELYTPVREMLNSCWCKWRPAAVQGVEASSSSNGSSSTRRSSRNVSTR